MTIYLDCPSCSRKFNLPDDFAGKAAKCPCGENLEIQGSATEDQLFAPLRFPEDHWNRVPRFSPTENLLAIGGNGTVTLWNVDDTSLVRVIYGKKDAAVASLAFTNDGKQLAVYFSDDEQVRVFNVATGDRANVFECGGWSSHFHGVAANDLFITSNRTNVETWNSTTAENVSSIQVNVEVVSAAIDQSGKFLVVARKDDDDLRVYETDTNDRVGTCYGEHQTEVTTVVAGSTNEMCLSLDGDGLLVVWQIPSGQMLRKQSLDVRAPESFVLSPCGSKACISGWSNLDDEVGVIVVVDVETLSVIRRIPCEDRPDMSFSADGKLLAISVSDTGIVVFDINAEKLELSDAVDVIPDPNFDQAEQWDEDKDPIAGEEQIEGTFDAGNWTLSTEGEIEWSDLLELVGPVKEAALVSSEEWEAAQASNRVMTIAHANDGMEYDGRVGVVRGTNLCSIVTNQSMPDDIHVVNVDIADIECDFYGAQTDTDQLSAQLITACQAEDLSTAAELIASGANVNHFDYVDDASPLTAVLKNGNIELANLLIENGIDVYSVNSAWDNAIIAGHFELAQTLKEGGFEVDEPSALIRACHAGALAATEKLLELVASPNESRNLWNYHNLNATPLTASALAGNAEIVNLLIHAGANVSEADPRGITPWVAAASGGHLEVCTILENNGAEPDVQHAFVVAADRCRIDVLAALIQQVAINATRPLDDTTVTAIEAAIIGGYSKLDGDDEEGGTDEESIVAAVTYLLEQGVPVGTTGDDGNALIHKATKSEQQQVVRVLAENGADVNSVNGEGETPLAIAVTCSTEMLLPTLLWRGADPNALTTDGQPAFLAMFGEWSQCDASQAKWFIGHGVNLDLTDEKGLTLVQHCELLTNSGDEDEDEYSVGQATDILELLYDEDRLGRVYASLRKIPESFEQLQQFVALIFDEFDSQELAFTVTDSYIKEKPDQSETTLVKLFQSDDWRHRYVAALVLSHAQLDCNVASKMILNNFADTDNDVVQALVGAMHQYGLPMAEAILGTLQTCPTSRLQLLATVLLDIDADRTLNVESSYSAMLPQNVDILDGADRLRAGVVVGVLGWFAGQREEFDKAVQLCEKSVTLNACVTQGFWYELGEFKSSLGDTQLQEAISLYNQMSEADDIETFQALREDAIVKAPDFPWPTNDLAWLLATAADPNLRDGERAVELAKSVCDQSNWNYWSFIDTLAAAYAEAGDFPNAMETAKKAYTIAAVADHQNIQETISRYEREEAWPFPVDEEDIDEEGVDDEY
jgi:ankyrin repeat protein/WD40 repeat protein/tetratricopeptide (TPR) repeat protein